MKQAPSLTTLFIFISFGCLSQDESVFNRLHGVEVKNSIFILYDGKEIKYKIDDERLSYPLDDNIFKVSNNHKNTLYTFISFYNPLKYKVEYSKKDIENPDIVALNEFLKNFPATAAIQISDENKNKAASLPGGVNNDAHEFNPTYLMYQWVLEFQSRVDVNKINENLDAYNKLIDRINKINGVEDYLFGKFPALAASVSLNEHISNTTNSLYKSNTYQEFKDALTGTTGSTALIKQLDDVKTKSENDFADIIKLLSDDFATVSVFLKNSERASFKNYSIAFKQDLVVKTKNTFDNNSTVIKKLKELNEKLKEEFEKYDPNGFKELKPSDKFDWKNNKWVEATVKATVINADGTSSSTVHTAKYVVSKDQGLALTSGAGAFYTPFAYKNFGLKDQAVAETKETKVFARPAFYLNLLFKRKKGDMLYWLGQIGIAVGNDSPLVPVGLGFVLRNNFSLTSGGLIAWQNKLEGLKIGETADDATLKNAIQKKIDLSWYVSINYQFAKK